MGGIRLIRRGNSNENLIDLTGVQWELGVRRDSEAMQDTRLSWSIMTGISGMHLNEADVVNQMSTTRYVRMNDVRLSFAAELRRPAAGESAVTGALGAYGVASWDAWTNKLDLDGDHKVRDVQLEGGVYVSGTMRGFSGQIMVSVIRPYTPGAQNVYALSVMPFGGGTPSGGKP
jgi:hypothetical protein